VRERLEPLEEPAVAGRRRHPARWVALGVGAGMVAFVVLLATRPSADERPIASELVGRPVPAVTGPTLDGGTYDIDRSRGRWVVVNFFATWCVPCQVEHPELVAFERAHAGRGDAEVVSIAFQDSPEDLRAFFERNGGDWPVVVGDTGRLAIAFGVTGVPESYVVAPDGRVVAKFEGVTADGLEQVISRFSSPAATPEAAP
jgi:cytochrome c biogenesis protein CcmG/thiol:disulfide interchange protein DsbE